MKFESNIWDPARFALCTCGWSGKFPNMRAAERVASAHIADGCEGCDHAVRYEEA